MPFTLFTLFTSGLKKLVEGLNDARVKSKRATSTSGGTADGDGDGDGDCDGDVDGVTFAAAYTPSGTWSATGASLVTLSTTLHHTVTFPGLRSSDTTVPLRRAAPSAPARGVSVTRRTFAAPPTLQLPHAPTKGAAAPFVALAHPPLGAAHGWPARRLAPEPSAAACAEIV
jgi:hypothetical protein